MAPRIATRLLVDALIRRAEAGSGFAAVIAKGDPSSGALLVLITCRGSDPIVYERLLAPSGDYLWSETRGAANAEETRKFLEKRRRGDPDLWVLELDVPEVERFVAEMNALG
jgi:hypothetical protein